MQKWIIILQLPILEISLSPSTLAIYLLIATSFAAATAADDDDDVKTTAMKTFIVFHCCFYFISFIALTSLV